MKPIFLIILLSLTSLLFVSAQPSVTHKYFFVSPDGKDKNEGTYKKPVQSLLIAQQLVRNYKQQYPETPVTVYLRGGQYYLDHAVVFTYEDSGSENAPVIYAAYPGEVPVISGGKKLSLQWKPYRDGVFKASVPEGLFFESLFVDDVQQVLARYPNLNPAIRIFNGTASDCVDKSKAEKWNNPEGGYFHVMHKGLWGDFHYQITGKKDNGELEMTGGWQNNRPENGIHPKYRFVENIFEELDTINEWFLDQKANLLYFKPDEKTDLKNARIEVAFLDNLVTFKGSEEKPVQYIALSGLTFNRSIRTFMKTSTPLLRSDWAIYRGGAILLEGTEHCTIRDCELTQLGGNGIFVNHYNRNVGVSGCHIHEIGASAICFVGDTSAVRNPKLVPYGPPVSEEELDINPGPKNSSYPAECLVDNNLIHSIGRVEKQVAGVQISMAMHIAVRHNSIYDTPRAGINIGEGAWGGHLLEYNDVFNTVLETSDHGSFNSWGRDRYWMAGKQKTENRVKQHPGAILWDAQYPTVIRNNRFRCDHGWDIDLDDGSSYYTIYNNLCLNNGIKLREGYYRTVENNICINNGMHPHVWFDKSGDVVRGNLFGGVHRPIWVKSWGT